MGLLEVGEEIQFVFCRVPCRQPMPPVCLFVLVGVGLGVDNTSNFFAHLRTHMFLLHCIYRQPLMEDSSVQCTSPMRRIVPQSLKYLIPFSPQRQLHVSMLTVRGRRKGKRTEKGRGTRSHAITSSFSYSTRTANRGHTTQGHPPNRGFEVGCVDELHIVCVLVFYLPASYHHTLKRITPQLGQHTQHATCQLPVPTRICCEELDMRVPR